MSCFDIKITLETIFLRNLTWLKEICISISSSYCPGYGNDSTDIYGVWCLEHKCHLVVTIAAGESWPLLLVSVTKVSHVIMSHVPDNVYKSSQVSVIKVWHHVPLAGFCLSPYSLNVLIRHIKSPVKSNLLWTYENQKQASHCVCEATHSNLSIDIMNASWLLLGGAIYRFENPRCSFYILWIFNTR